jgi:hypothetical protein
MNILIISFPLSDFSIGGEDQICLQLKNEFNTLGHNVDIITRNTDDILNNNYDFILSLNHPINISNKKQSIWATWLFNENLGKDINSIISNKYDIYFSSSLLLHKQLIKDNIISEYLQFPGFPYYERLNDIIHPSKKEIDIIYLGNYNPEYKTQEKIDNFLIPCMSYNFKIYGGRKWLFDEQKKLFEKGIFDSKYFSKLYEYYYSGILDKSYCYNISDLAKIFINFNSPDQLNLGFINNRVFDLVKNGCFVITDNSDEQKELFKDCIEYSDGGNDLSEKLKFYLSNLDLIYEKQLYSLEYMKDYYKKNSFSSVCSFILNKVLKYKNKILEIRNKKLISFVIIINDINILDYCLKSIKDNKYNGIIKYYVYCLKNNRIHVLKTFEKNNIKINKINIVNDIYNISLKSSYFDNDNIIVSLYSNIIVSNDFIEKTFDYFNNNERLNICHYALIDNQNNNKVYGICDNEFIKYFNLKNYSRVPFCFYSIRNNFKEDIDLEWNNLILNNNKYRTNPNITNTIIFERKEERDKFIKSFPNNYIDIEKNEQDDILKEKKENIIKNNVFDLNIKNNQIRFSVFCEKFKPKSVFNYTNLQIIDFNEKQDIEKIIRKLESNYTIINPIDVNSFDRLCYILLSHRNYDIILFGEMIIIQTKLLYFIKPSFNINDLRDNILESNYSKIYINPITYDIDILKKDDKFNLKDKNGLKVAVLSMCGVSSYEDKYGIGGEHQVVHWLKNSFESRSDVYMCQMFDTYNYDLMNPDEYDIIFSNSCWRGVEHFRKRKDNLTIFWHFNMDSCRSTMETVEFLKYDQVWTNSLYGYEWLKEKNIPCKFKHLNASSQYHYPYQYNSSLYHCDVAYIGGYQVQYKGVDMINQFIKPCVGKDFGFTIYGNRLWKSEIQKKALITDTYFKQEYYDESYDPHYYGILPMQDFNICCKNTKIMVNFNADEQRDGVKVNLKNGTFGVNCLNDRPIWILACNGFVITDDFIATRTFFESDGKENCPVVFSTGGDDLIDKIRYYLDHEDERLEIANKGHDFIKKHKLYTDDTADMVVEEYYRIKNGL